MPSLLNLKRVLYSGYFCKRKNLLLINHFVEFDLIKMSFINILVTNPDIFSSRLFLLLQRRRILFECSKCLVWTKLFRLSSPWSKSVLQRFSLTFKHKTFLRRFVIFAQIVYRCVAMLPEQVLK